MSNCQVEDSNLMFALIQTQNATLPTLSSEFAVINSVPTVTISGLNIKSVYNLTIISNNSLGVAFSESQQFCELIKNCSITHFIFNKYFALGTNDIAGVNICPTMRTGMYNISCDYIIGCNYSGCSYELSSTNSNMNGSIRGKNYEVVSIDVNTQYNITVADINGDDVTLMQQLYVHFISLCLPATGQKIKKIICVVTINVFVQVLTLLLLV